MRPIVEYSAIVWDPYVAKNIQQVEMIQRRAARWVLRRYDRLDSVTDMLSSLKWRSLELLFPLPAVSKANKRVL